MHRVIRIAHTFPGNFRVKMLETKLAEQANCFSWAGTGAGRAGRAGRGSELGVGEKGE